eukprot:Amastigsp_a7225_80.p2 type:complete len:154 gc:universal Amastigsp_a7225_80:526-987(+)
MRSERGVEHKGCEDGAVDVAPDGRPEEHADGRARVASVRLAEEPAAPAPVPLARRARHVRAAAVLLRCDAAPRARLGPHELVERVSCRDHAANAPREKDPRRHRHPHVGREDVGLERRARGLGGGARRGAPPEEALAHGLGKDIKDRGRRDGR